MNRHIITLLILVIGLSLSCGNDSSTNPPATKVGSWALSVNGLPSGVDGNLILTGPNNYNRNLTGSIQINDLEIGNYLLLCDTAIHGVDTLVPTPASLVLTITQNDTVSTTVTYSPSQMTPKGSLTITITGLPSGETGYVRLSGPGIAGYIEVNQTTIFDSLQIGTFLVAAYGITASDGLNYRPKIDSQTVVVSTTPASVNVEYEPQYGTIQINVQGLPSGEDAEIRFYETGLPDSYIGIKKTEQIDSVAEGQYTVQAFEIEAGDGTIYRPEHYYQPVQVMGHQLSTVDVVYFPKYGSIAFTVGGLPQGLFADATLETPDLDYAILESIIIDSLEEGNYTVTANEVTATDGQVYKPDFDSATVTVNGGQVTNFSIQYKPKFGKLDLRITGLPNELAGDVTVTRDDLAIVGKFGVSTIIDSLVEGTYWVVSKEVVDGSNNIYKPERDSLQVYIIPPQTAIIHVKYKSNLGYLKIDISGLPDQTEADILVEKDDLGFTKHVTSPEVIELLEEGAYRIIIYEVTDMSKNESYYPALDTAWRSITGGDTTSINVIYKPGFRFEVYDVNTPGRIHGYSTGWCCQTYSDCSEFNGYTDYFDSTTMTNGYIVYGCDSISSINMITDSGYSASVSHTGDFGNSHASQQVVVSRQDRTIFIQNNLNAIATVPSCDVNGHAIFYAKIDGGYYKSGNAEISTSPNVVPSYLIIDIKNPKRDTIKVQFDYTGSGSATYDPSGPSIFSGGAWGGANLIVTEAVNTCTYYWSNWNQIYTFGFGTGDPNPYGNSVSGSEEIIITNPRTLLSVQYTNSVEVASWKKNESAPGDGEGAGTASLASSVLITVEQIKK